MIDYSSFFFFFKLSTLFVRKNFVADILFVTSPGRQTRYRFLKYNIQVKNKELFWHFYKRKMINYVSSALRLINL